MSQKILISTTSLRNWNLNINEQISVLTNFNIDGIELNFHSKEELRNLTLSQESLRTLKRFSFNTLHLPFRNITYAKKNVILKRIKDIYRKINAKFIVVHPNITHDYSIFEGMNITIENYGLTRKQFLLFHFQEIINMVSKGILNINKEFSLVPDQNIKLHKDLMENKSLKLVLYTSHTMSFNNMEIKKYIDIYRERIAGIHLSTFNNYKNHNLLHKTDKSILKHLDIIKELRVPLILEEKFNHMQKDNIKKELSFIRTWLNKT